MGEKENNNNQNGSPVTRWLRNAVLGATMADQPAMMTASGWRQNEKGDYVQDQQNNPHVKQLRDNLATEGMGVMLGEFGLPAIHGLYNLGVRSLAKSGNNWARAKVINKEMKDIKIPSFSYFDGDYGDVYLRLQHLQQLRYPQYHKNVVTSNYKSNINTWDDFVEKTKKYAPTSPEGFNYFAFKELDQNNSALTRAKQFYNDDVKWRMQQLYPTDYVIPKQFKSSIEDTNPYEGTRIFNFKYNTDDIGGNAYEGNLITINPETKFGQEMLDDLLVHEGEHIQRGKIRQLIEEDESVKPLFKSVSNQDKKEYRDLTAIMQYNGNTFNYGLPYFKQEAEKLDYGFRFDDEYLKNHDIYPLAEKGASARQLRYKISKDNNIVQQDLNDYIQNLSPEELITTMHNQSGYFNSFIKHLGEANGLFVDDFKSLNDYIKALSKTPYFDQRIQNIKDALLGSFKQGGIIGINNIGI